MDDWWLVRDHQGHTGWVLARMVDLDVPLDVAQYAEGQRIQAAFVLDTVQDSEKGAVAQYLMLLNENRDGLPYDFDQVRVFTWNLKRHRYETAYRERNIVGYFPVPVSSEDFGKEGTMPVFTVRKQNEDGSFTERKYRLIGNIVRPVLAPGEEAQVKSTSSPNFLLDLPPCQSIPYGLPRILLFCEMPRRCRSWPRRSKNWTSRGTIRNFSTSSMAMAMFVKSRRAAKVSRRWLWSMP